jgi:hypothetical protein
MSPTPVGKSRESSYSKRPTKANPLIHDRDDGRETRRKLFLKKVREDSEDRRWAARGGDDEMMRTIWIAEHRRREERQARDAKFVQASQEEEDIDEMELSQAPLNMDQSLDEVMADMVAQQEAEELEVLLLSMNEAESRHYTPPQEYAPPPETPYRSDDEDYDRFFMDVIQEEIKLVAQQQEPPEHAENDQDMTDIS